MAKLETAKGFGRMNERISDLFPPPTPRPNKADIIYNERLTVITYQLDDHQTMWEAIAYAGDKMAHSNNEDIGVAADQAMTKLLNDLGRGPRERLEKRLKGKGN